MRIWLMILILGLSLTTQAQNKKNEIRVGVPLSVYFFDISPIKIHRIKTRETAYIPIPTYFSYSRLVGIDFFISARLINYSLSYEDFSRANYNDEILSRHFFASAILLKKRIVSLFNFNVDISLGGIYRFSGGELFHVGYINHGTWIEEHLDYRPYNDFGFSIGNDVKCKLYKRFSLGLEIDYTRYFTEVSPNQLSTAIFLGYEF